MSRSHKKKRNVGIAYECLVRYISKALVEGDHQKSNKAIKVLKHHLKPNTQLYKEFRLVNALLRTTVSNPNVASSILQEAKTAARSHNKSALDREKSLLIRSINHSGLAEDGLYDQQINEYRVLATIQTLLNDWRSSDPNLERMGQYEEQLVTWLTTPKDQSNSNLMSESAPGSQRLLMRVMMKKLNEKYSGNLNARQKDLIRAYVWSSSKGDVTQFREKLQEVKDEVMTAIDVYSARNTSDKYVLERLGTTREKLVSEDLDSINDETVTRFLLYTKLCDEMTSEE